MAQINRIRVNNVKYNFGTQFYDDFVMRFSGKNTIYDLANGGGKSVLMLLLLQNMIPNCTLDDKQPIEKLFRSGNGNTTIHSLVEWKLDACDIRNGFKYMTTGFCARKGRDQGEEADSNRETANIEYFNYCIFYREFGENDIRNLPLVKNGERITYNGLKSYLRDLERRDFGVEVKIFDRKGDYQNFISNYGLYESQWEIVRGINKTEGHVRTYFENNYKTTRKVVEDLLIEEIIEKSYNNRIRKDSDFNDDEEMAKTLLDIKDKLIELSKRKGEINRYDEQIALLDRFGSGLQDFKVLYSDRADIEKRLLDTLLVCRGKAADTRNQLENLLGLVEELKNKFADETKLVALAEIETEILELEKLNSLIEDTTADRNRRIEAKNRSREELYLHENAADYKDYLANKKLYDETKELINNSSTEESKALTQMAALAATKAAFVTDKTEKLTLRKSESEGKLTTLSEQYDKTIEEEQQLFGKVKISEGILQGLESEIAAINSELDELMQETGMLVADRAWELCETAREKINSTAKNISDIEKSIKDNDARNVEYMSSRVTLESNMAKLSEEESYLLHELDEASLVQEKLDKMKSVYGGIGAEQLESIMEELLYKLNRERTANEEALEKLYAYLKCIQNHELPEYDIYYSTVLDYLKNRYGENIISGREILQNMQGEKAANLLETLPQTAFSIFVREADNSYEEICQDKVLTTLNTGSFVIPVLKYSVIEDGTQPFDSEEYVAVCRNMGFLWDEAALAAEIQKTTEDISKYEETVRKNADKCQLVTEDIVFIKTVKGRKDADSIRNRLDAINREKGRITRQREAEIIKVEELNASTAQLYTALENEQTRLEELKKENLFYERTAKNNDKLQSKYQELKDNQAELAKTKKEYGLVLQKSAYEKSLLEQAQSDFDRVKEQLEEIEKDFSANYKPYMSENVQKISGLTEEETDAKMSALKKVISGEMGDISDKEKLLASYEAAMKKSADSILYRGMSMDEAQKAFEEGKMVPCSMDEMLRLKNKVAEAEKSINEADSAIDSQSAQKNRMEGSIEHGKRQYNDKYGEFVREEISNPQGYILSHRQEMSRIQEQILETENKRKNLENDNKDILFMEKDIERIIRNAGLEVPENAVVSGSLNDITTEDYEQLQKQFERLQKEEHKLQNRFTEDKQKLIDALNHLEAYELADEVRNSLIAPNGVPAVEDMVQSIQDTNECIALERDRIEKSISDMERIKDSFENRCVQICSNIRTELDRLPKLSRITLDDEVISIITLSIPYIKEEMYKDRMSVYINETIAGAETFNNPADKLKYMKNRLSWKKMFSVIVTDMNSIKLCLYKREHIKDQSRYLKYEEAVGSTGQSQGIYIQFLIAIIHYIASLNALGKDTAVIGKTIFIDNPFGAAKDVYIWEPIFKLLKTNHVQLIVPARGATPAITKMFDVNYVLGQKMVANRQQTVVVDYRSQIQAEEMEYNIMEYTQTTLDIM